MISTTQHHTTPHHCTTMLSTTQHGTTSHYCTTVLSTTQHHTTPLHNSAKHHTTPHHCTTVLSTTQHGTTPHYCTTVLSTIQHHMAPQSTKKQHHFTSVSPFATKHACGKIMSHNNHLQAGAVSRKQSWLKFHSEEHTSVWAGCVCFERECREVRLHQAGYKPSQQRVCCVVCTQTAELGLCE